MDCPHCQSLQVVKSGRESLSASVLLQRYRCNDCGKRFNERTGTPMARLRTPSSVVATALNSRTEGIGVRAAGRTFSKSYSTILRWEERLANQVNQWPPPAPGDREVTLEGDEVYTHVSENRPSPLAQKDGQSTLSNAVVATGSWPRQARRTNCLLFQWGAQQAWQWAQACLLIRWFTDGERRYAKELWDLASVNLALRNCSSVYRTRKVWREGLEVAIKVKGSQGQRRVVWVKTEHPFTAISLVAEVHANHNEAQNAALRRRCSAYRRRQNLGGVLDLWNWQHRGECLPLVSPWS